MKYITSALVLIALFGAQSEQANAIKLDAGFTDDLVKSLAQEMNADAEKGEAEPEQEKPALAQQTQKTEAKTEKKVEKKADAKTDKKADAKKDAKKDAAKKVEKKVEKKAEKVDDEIPMDTAAIKAYSSVIADAAEDSEP